MKKHAEMIVDRSLITARVDERIFGSSIEHPGHAVCTGLYQPEHPMSDEEGFRRDVIELVRALCVPVIRYPGGNFVSNFYWGRQRRPGRTRRPGCWKTSAP